MNTDYTDILVLFVTMPRKAPTLYKCDSVQICVLFFKASQLFRRKRHHIINFRCICKKHYKPVNAEGITGCIGHEF